MNLAELRERLQREFGVEEHPFNQLSIIDLATGQQPHQNKSHSTS
jgi:hypothetical protein